MDHSGIDVHKKESQICILAEEGELIKQRIRTEPKRFVAVLGERSRVRIGVEASREGLPPGSAVSRSTLRSVEHAAHLLHRGQ